MRNKYWRNLLVVGFIILLLGTNATSIKIKNIEEFQDIDPYKRNTSSTEIEWSWAKKAGGNLYDIGFSISSDNEDNTYITGSFSDIAYFDSISLNSNGEYDIFIAKMDSQGNWLWAKSTGGSGNDIGWGIDVDSSGNLYVIGMFSGNVTFGTESLLSSGDEDIFICKLDTNGQWIWATRAGGSRTETVDDSISVDSSGNVYLTGSFNGTAEFGHYMLTSTGDDDVFVAKLNYHGVWTWAEKAGGTSYDQGVDICVDSIGNAIVTGGFSEVAYFGSIPLTSVSGGDMFVARIDTDGSWLWAKGTNGSGSLRSQGIDADNDGNLYVTGYFDGVKSFGSTTLTSAHNDDIFVTKLSSGGNWIWAARAGETSSSFSDDEDEAYDIVTDYDGDCYITGAFLGSVAFGNTIFVSIEEYDTYVAKISSSGEWLWALQAGGYGTELGSAVTINSKKYPIITGYFTESVTFGETVLNAEILDIFVAKADVGDTQAPVVEIVNPKDYYFHFSGIPSFRLPPLFAYTMAVAGFRLEPIKVKCTDNVDSPEDIQVTISVNDEFIGYGLYDSESNLFECRWTGFGLGIYTLNLSAVDLSGNIGWNTTEIWYLCFFP